MDSDLPGIWNSLRWTVDEVLLSIVAMGLSITPCMSKAWEELVATYPFERMKLREIGSRFPEEIDQRCREDRRPAGDGIWSAVEWAKTAQAQVMSTFGLPARFVHSTAKLPFKPSTPGARNGL